MTALAIVPLFTGASVAVNLARINLEAAKMQDGLDAAAFSALKSYGDEGDQTKAKDLANTTFFANFGTSEIVDQSGSGSSPPPASQAIKVAFGALGVETTATATYELTYPPLSSAFNPIRSIASALPRACQAEKHACWL